MKKARKPRSERSRIPDLVRRQRALAKTMEAFAGKPFELGSADCVQLVRVHLAAMGHKGIPKPVDYSTPTGASRALKALGFDHLEPLFDSLFPRIAPAFMLPGDIALVRAEKGAPAWRTGTVVIGVGRKFLGWHPDAEYLAINEPTVVEPFVAAWRV